MNEVEDSLCDDSDLSESSSDRLSSDSDIDEYSNTDKSMKNYDTHKYDDKIVNEYAILKDNSPRKRSVDINFSQRSKNRYNDIIPFQDTRVLLLDGSGDYINANYVTEGEGEYEGEDNSGATFQEHKYIATQGPLENTVSDFWEMVWQNNSELIVMVCKLYEKNRQKCYKYWPHNKQSKKFKKDLEVVHTNSSKIGEIIVRTFTISKNQEIRTVYHIQLSSWPDFGVPDPDTFLSFVNVYRNHLKKTKLNGYVIVHCSAGVGRTGTFLAIDLAMNQMIKTGKVCDVKKIVYYIRTKRGKMIQTKEQYSFVYKVLVNYVMHNKIEICESDDDDSFGNLLDFIVHDIRELVPRSTRKISENEIK